MGGGRRSKLPSSLGSFLPNLYYSWARKNREEGDEAGRERISSKKYALLGFKKC